MGAVIRRVFRIYVDQAPVLMPAAALVFVFTGILSAVLIAAGPSATLLAALISLTATTLFTGMVVELVSAVRQGRRDASVRRLLAAVMPVLGQLVLVGFVGGVCVVLGFIVLIIPGLILLTLWFLAAPVVVLERPPGLGALGRSRELVRGNGWQVFAVIFLLAILVAVISGLLGLAAETAGTGAAIVTRVVLGVLTAPLPALAAAVLYFELHGKSTSGAPATAADPGGQEPR